MEELGMKELNEMFDGLDVLAEFGGEVLKNGEVGVEDISALVSLATKFQTLEAAYKNIDGAVAEAKDLDQAEVVALVGRVYGVIKKFSEAKK